MERRATTVFLVLFLVLWTGNADQETFMLYFRQGDEKIPITIEMDTKEKIAYVISNTTNENISSLYDYKAKVIAFKDFEKKCCYLEKMQDPSLIYERRLLRSLRNQVLLGSPDVLFAQTPALTQRQIIHFGGKTVERFCAGTEVFKITDKNLHSGRKKRQTSNRGFMERTYSHHEQHSQSYAKFGHETLSYEGGVNKLVGKLTSNYLLPNLKNAKLNDKNTHDTTNLQQTVNPISYRQYYRRNPQIMKQNRSVHNKNINRSIRAIPRTRAGIITNPNSHINPNGVRANSLTSQISSHLYSRPLSSETGFTATGKFNLANAQANGYGSNYRTLHSGSNAQHGRLNAEKTQSINGNYPNSFSTENHYSDTHYLPKHILTGEGINFPQSEANNYQLRPSILFQDPSIPSMVGNRGISSQNYNSRFPVLQTTKPILSNGQLAQAYNNFPTVAGRDQPSFIQGNLDRNFHQTSYSNKQVGGTKDYGLSSQSQVDIKDGNAQGGATAQGAFAGANAQTQVQGGSSRGGTFQAQAQSGSNQGSSQSQTHGSETGAQSSASTHLSNIGQSQSQAHLSYESQIAQANAQTLSNLGSINAQSQGDHLGGQASSQSQGPGKTSSSAQVGYEDKDNQYKKLTNPFTGQAMASSHGGSQDGQSQTFVKGNLQTGSSYRATAQGSYGQPQTNLGPVAIALPGTNGINYLTTGDTSVTPTILDRSHFVPSEINNGHAYQNGPPNFDAVYTNGREQHFINKARQSPSDTLSGDRIPSLNYQQNHPVQYPQTVSYNSPDYSNVQVNGNYQIPQSSLTTTHMNGQTKQIPLANNQLFLDHQLRTAKGHQLSSENIPSQLIQKEEINRGYIEKPFPLFTNHGQLPTNMKSNGNSKQPYSITSDNFNQQSILKTPGIQTSIHDSQSGMPNSKNPITHSLRKTPFVNGAHQHSSQTQILGNGFQTQTNDQTVHPFLQLPSSLKRNATDITTAKQPSNLYHGVIQAHVQGIYLPLNKNGRESIPSTNDMQNSGKINLYNPSINSNNRKMIPNQTPAHTSYSVIPNVHLQNGENSRTFTPNQGSPVYKIPRDRSPTFSSNMGVSVGLHNRNTHQQSTPIGINGRTRNCGISTCSNGFRIIKSVKICFPSCQKQ